MYILQFNYNLKLNIYYFSASPSHGCLHWRRFQKLPVDTVAITLVAYAVSVSLAMIYADKHGYSIDPNQVDTMLIIWKVLKGFPGFDWLSIDL